jgi:hypothetical protein
VCSSITPDCTTLRRRANGEKDRRPEDRSASQGRRAQGSVASATASAAAGRAGQPTSSAPRSGCGGHAVHRDQVGGRGPHRAQRRRGRTPLRCCTAPRAPESAPGARAARLRARPPRNRS